MMIIGMNRLVMRCETKKIHNPPSSTLQDSLKGVLHQFSFQLYFGTSSLEIYLKYTWDIKRQTVPEFSHVGQTNPQDATFAIQITQVVMVRWWAMIACGNFLSRSANTIKRSYIAQLHNVCSLQKGKKSGLVQKLVQQSALYKYGTKLAYSLNTLLTYTCWKWVIFWMRIYIW